MTETKEIITVQYKNQYKNQSTIISVGGDSIKVPIIVNLDFDQTINLIKDLTDTIASFPH